METLYELNPLVSWLEKGGKYALYLNFNYIFFRGQAAQQFHDILSEFAKSKQLNLRGSFVAYLVDKNILQEVRNG